MTRRVFEGLRDFLEFLRAEDELHVIREPVASPGSGRGTGRRGLVRALEAPAP